MLALAKTCLKTSSQNHLFGRDNVTITTTDGMCKSYVLPIKLEDKFLKQCSDLIEERNQLHLNVVLNSLPVHCLLIDADCGSSSSFSSSTTIGEGGGDIHSQARNLYTHIVQRIYQDLFVCNDDETPAKIGSPALDAFLFLKPNSPNFHLIFPHLYLERHDICWFLERLKKQFPYVDNNVQGWMIYGCTKTKDGLPYQVVGCFKQNAQEETYFLAESELNVLLKGTYPKTKLKYIWTNLFYPGISKLKLGTYFMMRYGRINTIVENDRPALSYENDDCRLLFSYLDDDYNIRRTYSFLRKDLFLYTNKEKKTSFENSLFEWLKIKQNDYDFRHCESNINVYLYNFKPVCYREQEANEDLGLVAVAPRSSSETSEIDEINQKLGVLVPHVGHKFSPTEMEPVLRDYQKYYPSVLEEIFNKLARGLNNELGEIPLELYDIRTLKYEFARLYGEPLNVFEDCLVPKRLLTPLFGIMHQGQIERVAEFVAGNILPFIPFTVQDNEVRLFNWLDRHWKYRIPTSGFFKLLLCSLCDYVLNHTSIEDLKLDLRKCRRAFCGECQNLQTAVCLKFYSPQKFDTNPWILGLDGGFTYDLINSICRLTIPQDYVSKTARLSACYQHLPQEYEPFKIFVDRHAYLAALDKLREHLETNCGEMETFDFTSDPKVNLLFAFLGTVFCEDFDEMYFFLSYAADCLIGQNYRRWILFLFGETSNGKTSLTRLCQSALGNYAGVLSPEQFYDNKNRSAEGASPELVAKLGCRLLVVEEISHQFNISVANLNSLTGNNRRYVRGLYQSGVEYDVSFQMICTMNKFPKLEITSAVKQRLKVLVLRSSFLSEVKTYDFDERRFPQCPNLKTDYIADSFLGLLLHLLKIQRSLQNIETTTKVHQILVPDSVDHKLKSLESMNTPIAQFIRSYVLTAERDEYLSIQEVQRHLQNFMVRNPLLCSDETSKSLYQQFELTYFQNLGPNEFRGEKGYYGLTLAPFESNKRARLG